jgi:hypothetical protein
LPTNQSPLSPALPNGSSAGSASACIVGTLDQASPRSGCGIRYLAGRSGLRVCHTDCAQAEVLSARSPTRRRRFTGVVQEPDTGARYGQIPLPRRSSPSPVLPAAILAFGRCDRSRLAKLRCARSVLDRSAVNACTPPLPGSSPGHIWAGSGPVSARPTPSGSPAVSGDGHRAGEQDRGVEDTGVSGGVGIEHGAGSWVGSTGAAHESQPG